MSTDDPRASAMMIGGRRGMMAALGLIASADVPRGELRRAERAMAPIADEMAPVDWEAVSSLKRAALERLEGRPKLRCRRKSLETQRRRKIAKLSRRANR